MTMEAPLHSRNNRLRGFENYDGPAGRRPNSRNKQWVAGEGGRSETNTPAPPHADGERRGRGTWRGGRGGRGLPRGSPRKFPNHSLKVDHGATRHSFSADEEESHDTEEGSSHGLEEEQPSYDAEEGESHVVNDEEVVPPDGKERVEFKDKLKQTWEAGKAKAIAEGKMDDPKVAKRLEDAITMVGTCMDMCPRHERLTRDMEGLLDDLEAWFEPVMKNGVASRIKHVDHRRAVKRFERAQGDKLQPSDLRPPKVLKRTLDYLFNELLPQKGYSATNAFISDRTRAVRSDFVIQRECGPIAMECHDRCVRFHILSLHLHIDEAFFNFVGEEKYIMNALQSLKEYYEDQRGKYDFQNELEMRVYHRLIHIRDQVERQEVIPAHISQHPVFKLTTKFRRRVQDLSVPISKTSSLVVDGAAMQIFAELVGHLKAEGSVVMIFLVACILERLFGKGTVPDIDALRGDLTDSQIINGVSVSNESAPEDSFHDIHEVEAGEEEQENVDQIEEEDYDEEDVNESAPPPELFQPTAPALQSNTFVQNPPAASPFGAAPPAGTALPPAPPLASAFSGLKASSRVFGTPTFGQPVPSNSSPAPVSAFSNSNSSFASGFSKSDAAPPVLTNSFASTSASPFMASSSTFGPDVAAAARSGFGSTSSPVPVGNGAANGFAPQFASSSSSSLFGAPAANSASTSAAQEATVMQPATNGNPFGGYPTLNPHAPAFAPSIPPPSTFDSQQQQTFNSPTPPSAPVVSPLAPASASASSPSFFPAVSSSSFSPSASGSGSSRTSLTPPLPRIDTSTPSPSHFSQTQFSSDSAPLSAVPQQPPLLPRKLPISLPSTPTTAPQNPLLGAMKNSLITSLEPSRSEVLSPLSLSSPSISRSATIRNFDSPSRNGSLVSINGGPSQENILSPSRSKGKDVIPSTPPQKVLATAEDLDAKVLAFTRTCFLVKDSFRRWRKRTTDRAAWVEACRHSEAYREKIHSSPSSRSLSDRKRPFSTLNGSESNGSPRPQPQRKRMKKRVSSEYQPPRTDEGLAKRFIEVQNIPFSSVLLNKEERQRHWAHGSFLQAIRTHVEGQAKATSNSLALLEAWHMWISVNTDNDTTAIWLERKFDISDSGHWASDTVFSIPLRPGTSSPAVFPGVIIFECTPVDDITDPLEKKYRVLDDCTRLRDLVQLLPPKRHFVPSLLIFRWSKDETMEPGSDLVDMINKLVEDSTISGYHTLNLTTASKDLDVKFSEALQYLTLDLKGKLVQPVTLRGVFKLFQVDFESFASEWVDNCSVHGGFDWNLFCRLVGVIVQILNGMAQLVSKLVSVDPKRRLPEFCPRHVVDSESTYDVAMEWLAGPEFGSAADSITVDLHSHREMGRNFPSQAFISHIYDLVQYLTEEDLGISPKTLFYVPSNDIAPLVAQFERLTQSYQATLGQILSLSVRRSPKRRSASVDSELTSSASSKRRRLTPFTDAGTEERSLTPSPLANGRSSPSPSESTASLAPTETPLVTVAMLRALTKDMKQKYGR